MNQNVRKIEIIQSCDDIDKNKHDITEICYRKYSETLLVLRF